MSDKKNTGKSREYNPSGRRWWLKLQFALFSDKRVRALRRKHGDLALIIYQKIMLKSLENDSSMRFEGLEETFEDEIAVDIMEDTGDSVQLIREIMDFLIQHRLMVEQEDKSYFFPQAAEMSGDESSAAERMRRMRARYNEASQCYAEPLQSDSQPSQGYETSQCYADASHRYQIQNDRTDRTTATDIAKAKAISVAEQKAETEEADSAFASAERDASAAADAAAPPAGELFSLRDLLDICNKHDIDLCGEGVSTFLSEMQASGWVLYKKPITKDGIVKALRGWAKYHEEYHADNDYKLERRITKVLEKYLGSDKAAEFVNSDDTEFQLELIQKCPVGAFSDEMLDYLEDEWGIEPR